MVPSKYGIWEPLRVSGPWTVDMQSVVHSFRATNMFVDWAALLPLFWLTVLTRLLSEQKVEKFSYTILLHQPWSTRFRPIQVLFGLFKSVQTNVVLWVVAQIKMSNFGISSRRLLRVTMWVFTDLFSFHSDKWYLGSKRKNHFSCSRTNA